MFSNEHKSIPDRADTPEKKIKIDKAIIELIRLINTYAECLFKTDKETSEKKKKKSVTKPENEPKIKHASLLLRFIELYIKDELLIPKHVKKCFEYIEDYIEPGRYRISPSSSQKTEIINAIENNKSNLNLKKKLIIHMNMF